MKTTFLILALLTCSAAGAQNPFLSQLSDTDVIQVRIKGSGENQISYHGVTVKEVVVTGTVRKVMAFLLKNIVTLLPNCNCLALNPVECLEEIRDKYSIKMNIQNYKQLDRVSLEFPNPADFNAIQNALTKPAPAGCEWSLCMKICRDEVCFSVKCEDELEICYNGEYSLSVTNGQVVASATVK